MEDLHRVYFSFIHDASQRSRDDADKILSGSKDTYVRELHEAGKAIGKAVRDEAGPAALDPVVEKMKELPLLDYWKEFIEISGQVVIGKALSVENPQKRKALLEQGLRILSIATFGAFPLSDYSSELIMKAKRAEPSISETADAIMMSDLRLEPWSPSLRRRYEGRRTSGTGKIRS